MLTVADIVEITVEFQRASIPDPLRAQLGGVLRQACQYVELREAISRAQKHDPRHQLMVVARTIRSHDGEKEDEQ